jgi:hypothetical protein
MKGAYWFNGVLSVFLLQMFGAILHLVWTHNIDDLVPAVGVFIIIGFFWVASAIAAVNKS